MAHSLHRITTPRRAYNRWVADESIEDYALRFTPRSFRKWSEFRVATTALGSLSFLVLEAMGGFMTLTYGFTNTLWGVLTVGGILFLLGLPISIHAARHGVDMDLLTRGAGFGYLGSTVTSLVYAAFTFTLFALEASIMSQALAVSFNLPMPVAHIISASVIVPLVIWGISGINRLQYWSQPLWMLLAGLPYAAVLWNEPEILAALGSYPGATTAHAQFDWLAYGAVTTLAFSLVAQIGEQVDFLRFLPEKTADNRFRWWTAVLVGGPGWVLFGVLRQLGGAVLAYLAVSTGTPAAHGHEPSQMFLAAYREVFQNPTLAVAFTTLLIVVSQVKINVTNAYAGSLAWSNFFSRLTHRHPGRITWVVFNIAIALLLMELDVFDGLEHTLRLFSLITLAWVGALVADLSVCKPLGWSPPGIEFKRAHLPDVNLVGLTSMITAVIVSGMAHLGIFGPLAGAFSALIALICSFAVTIGIAALVRGRHYMARPASNIQHGSDSCCICENTFEPEDMAQCPVYAGTICSLCCSLDSRCLDACKPGHRLIDQLETLAHRCLPGAWPIKIRLRILRFLGICTVISAIVGLILWTIYTQASLSIPEAGAEPLKISFMRLFWALLVLSGFSAIWLTLSHEANQLAHEETARQTQRLLDEIRRHQNTDGKLKQAQRLADRANQAKTRFVGGISHEIRAPLHSIIGYAHLLVKAADIPVHRREYLESIEHNGKYLSALVDDIIDISSIESGKITLQVGDFQLLTLVGQLASDFRPRARAKGLFFRLRILDSLPEASRGDERRIRQILINLVSNAVKFTRTGGIEITLRYRSSVAQFEVRDTGPGIPAHEQDNIFLPFYRALSEGNAALGSGLGLTISKLLAQVMGGELSLESTVDVGSCFRLRLFLPQPFRHGVEAPATSSKITGYTGNPRRILIVDDAPAHRQLLRAILESHGFHVTEASSGLACINAVAIQTFDLILIDWMMPDMRGDAAVSQLRRQGLGIPIIGHSACVYPIDRARMLDAGCDGFIAKPLNVDELLDTLKVQLGLEWLSDEPPPQPQAAPPQDTHPITLEGISPEVIDLLRSQAEVGDIRALRRELDRIAPLYPAHQPAIDRLQELAREFQLRDLQWILEERPGNREPDDHILAHSDRNQRPQT